MFCISWSGFNSSGGTGSALMLTLVAFSWIPIAAGFVGFGLYPSNSLQNVSKNGRYIITKLK